MRTFIAIILIVIFSAGCAFGESLWPEKKTDSDCADKKAHKVGDIVTIVIAESSTSAQQASTDAKKESELKAGPGVGPLLEKLPLFEYEGGDSMKASGQTSRSSKFTARISAKVTKVQENGNLEIEGVKFVQTNTDKEEIKLTGVIRPNDIAPDNTVLSTYIADARITNTGSGPVSSRQKEGLISRLFRILF